jgi:threonine dehydratase
VPSQPVTAPTLESIRAARERISGTAVRTPLISVDISGRDDPVGLKLENLQPIGSFKLRGAANATARAGVEALRHGVVTASAGNMAQGVAWCARRLGVPCHVVVPDRAPETKTAAIERLGARIVRVPFDQWWQTLADRRYPGLDGKFIHPFADTDVMAGNGTIALEIFDDLPEVDTVVVPWGGGGLCCGIGAALRALSPRTRICAVEVDTAAPLTASRARGRPERITRVPSFVDGMGGKEVTDEMWPLAQTFVDDVVVVSPAQIAGAIRFLVERCRVVAEGAGAAPMAAVMAGSVRGRRVVCVTSGGNLDLAALAAILRGETPEARA